MGKLFKSWYNKGNHDGSYGWSVLTKMGIQWVIFVYSSNLSFWNIIQVISNMYSMTAMKHSQKTFVGFYLCFLQVKSNHYMTRFKQAPYVQIFPKITHTIFIPRATTLATQMGHMKVLNFSIFCAPPFIGELLFTYILPMGSPLFD